MTFFSLESLNKAIAELLVHYNDFEMKQLETSRFKQFLDIERPYLSPLPSQPYQFTLRLAQVIGLGEREGYLLQTYLKNAKEGLPIKVFGKNIGKRHYVYAKDVVNAIKAALLQSDRSGIYNIGMEKTYSFNELAETINRAFGNQSKILQDSDAPADESVYHMSIEKAQTELGWKPQYDLEQTYQDIKTDS